MINKTEANARLIERYGIYEDGKPRFRVVWSTDEKEKRVGEHEEYYNEIFVRKFFGVAEYPKYSFCPDRWVLEMRVPTHNPELTEQNSYEPLWVLQDKNGNYLPLNWDAIEIIIQALNRRPKRTMMNWKDEAEAEDADLAAAKKRDKELLEQILPSPDSLEYKMALGEGITLSTNQQAFKAEKESKQ